MIPRRSIVLISSLAAVNLGPNRRRGLPAAGRVPGWMVMSCWMACLGLASMHVAEAFVRLGNWSHKSANSPLRCRAAVMLETGLALAATERNVSTLNSLLLTGSTANLLWKRKSIPKRASWMSAMKKLCRMGWPSPTLMEMVR